MCAFNLLIVSFIRFIVVVDVIIVNELLRLCYPGPKANGQGTWAPGPMEPRPMAPRAHEPRGLWAHGTMGPWDQGPWPREPGAPRPIGQGPMGTCAHRALFAAQGLKKTCFRSDRKGRVATNKKNAELLKIERVVSMSLAHICWYYLYSFGLKKSLGHHAADPKKGRKLWNRCALGAHCFRTKYLDLYQTQEF